MYTFYGNYCVYLCVYIVFMLIFNKCVKLRANSFTVCLKCAKRLIPLNIYPHNTLQNDLKYIAQEYTLLYTIIM